MDLFALFTSTQGRLERRAFVLGLLAVYLAGVAAQTLISGEVTARAGLTPFVAAQAGLMWAWLALHIKRLRDAGKGPGGAIGVAVIYGLALSLLVMLVFFLTNPNAVGLPAEGARQAGEGVMGLLLVIFIFGLLFSPDFGMFTTILKMLIFIACLPAVISIVFSVVTGLRKSVAPGVAPAP
jgi:uncharacterized membrane protein YhaH (DUF805 family)